jgi:hypothetical protein
VPQKRRDKSYNWNQYHPLFIILTFTLAIAILWMKDTISSNKRRDVTPPFLWCIRLVGYFFFLFSHLQIYSLSIPAITERTNDNKDTIRVLLPSRKRTDISIYAYLFLFSLMKNPWSDIQKINHIFIPSSINLLKLTNSVADYR